MLIKNVHGIPVKIGAPSISVFSNSKCYFYVKTNKNKISWRCYNKVIKMNLEDAKEFFRFLYGYDPQIIPAEDNKCYLVVTAVDGSEERLVFRDGEYEGFYKP